MRTRIRKRPIAEINVVPYIDVMLVLLVIFMITTPLLTQGVKVDLPKAQAEAIDAKQQEPIILTIDKNGQYFLNIANNPDRPLSADQISTRISAELDMARKKNQTPTILVKGDAHVDYGEVVQAMVLLQKAGAESVGLMTEQKRIEG